MPGTDWDEIQDLADMVQYRGGTSSFKVTYVTQRQVTDPVCACVVSNWLPAASLC